MTCEFLCDLIVNFLIYNRVDASSNSSRDSEIENTEIYKPEITP